MARSPRPHVRRLRPRGAAPVRAIALLAAFLATLAPLARAEGLPDAPVRSASLDAGGTLLRLETDAGTHRYGLDAWRAWARGRVPDAVEEPLAIGPVEVGVEDFSRFGAAAASPAGERVAFTVTTYAMLTTLSLVHVLDVPEGRLRVLPEARLGDVQEPTWSPDGALLAYALGTARAGGEALHVDAADGSGARVALPRQAMYEAWLASDLPIADAVGPDAYAPWFRDLNWDAAGDRLYFTVDAPGAGIGEPAPDAGTGVPPARWSVARDGSGLRPEARR